ncbi:hypothetical protein, partial [Rhodococcus sp. HNM0563]|uniref:hypothetical protein n=1 Tax=Rhodococcus sp. HNM0563 TaxID=2716339 RepID=UPI00197EC5EE
PPQTEECDDQHNSITETISVIAPKIFGTDIHRHTVEFSKNTRTPSLFEFSSTSSGATVPTYHSQHPGRKPSFASDRDRSCGLEHYHIPDPVGSGWCPCRSNNDKVTPPLTERQIAW